MPTRTLPLGVLLACATVLGAGDEKPAVQSDPAAVRELVEQLGSEDFGGRERATQELSKLEEAPEALQEATKSGDPEVAQRAQRVVDLITARAEGKVIKRWVKWAQSKDFISNAPHNPLVVLDKVVVGTDKGQLRAYRCQDGKALWVHQHGSRIFHRPCSDGER